MERHHTLGRKQGDGVLGDWHGTWGKNLTDLWRKVKVTGDTEYGDSG